MSKKLPAFQFYPGDWRKDPALQSLDYETRGIWIELLCMVHESEDRGKLMIAGRAMTDSETARLLGIEEARAQQAVSKLEANGVADRCSETGALMNRRMVRDNAIREARSRAGRKGGKASSSKRASKPQTTVSANRGSSVSSSVSSSPSSEQLALDVDRIILVLNEQREAAGLAPLGQDEPGRDLLADRLREHGVELVEAVVRYAPEDSWGYDKLSLRPLFSPASFQRLADARASTARNGHGNLQKLEW